MTADRGPIPAPTATPDARPSGDAHLPGLRTYLINLDRATGRLARMTARLDAACLPFERVPAVDGAMLPDDLPEFSARGYALLHGRRRMPAEIGCYLSHVACARRLLATDATHALILEDDVTFSDDAVDLLRAALARGAGWDILRLTTVNSGRAIPYAALTPGRALGVALTREKGAGAYVINRRAAAWFVDGLIPMRLAWDIAFDLEYLRGLRAAFVVPVPFAQASEPVSQIQGGVKASKLPRWRYLTVLPTRLWLESTRLVLRGLRLVGLRLGLLPAG